MQVVKDYDCQQHVQNLRMQARAFVKSHTHAKWEIDTRKIESPGRSYLRPAANRAAIKLTSTCCMKFLHHRKDCSLHYNRPCTSSLASARVQNYSNHDRHVHYELTKAVKCLPSHLSLLSLLYLNAFDGQQPRSYPVQCYGCSIVHNANLQNGLQKSSTM